MDVLELPRPVINFLRTMSKEMHRYSLCWDIYGGNEGVTLTLTWKLQSGGAAAAATSSSSSSSNNEVVQSTVGGGGDTTDGEQDTTTTTAINSSSSNGPPLATASSTDLNQLLDAYTKKNDSMTPGFISDSGGGSSSGKKRVIGCAKLQLGRKKDKWLNKPNIYVL